MIAAKPKLKLLPASAAILNFEAKKAQFQVGVGTVEKFILENMGIVVEILSPLLQALGGIELDGLGSTTGSASD